MYYDRFCESCSPGYDGLIPRTSLLSSDFRWACRRNVGDGGDCIRLSVGLDGVVSSRPCDMGEKSSLGIPSFLGF